MKKNIFVLLILLQILTFNNDVISQSLSRIWAKGRSFGWWENPDLMAFSYDGKFLFTGMQDYSVKAWNSITGEFEYKVGYLWDLNTIECSPDNEKIAYGGEDGILNIYNYKEDKFQYRISYVEYKMTRGINKVKFSGTGLYLAIDARTTTSPSLKIFNLKDSTYVYPKPSQGKFNYNNLKFSNDDFFYACDQIEYINYPLKSVNIDIYATSDHSIVKQLTFQTTGNYEYNFTKEFLYVLVNDTIHYHNLITYDLEDTFPFKNKVAVFSVDANYAIVNDTLNFVSVWNLQEKKKLYSIEILEKGSDRFLYQISPDNRFFAVSGVKGKPTNENHGTSIECYELKSGKKSWNSKEEFSSSSCVSLSPNKKWTLTSNQYGFWNLINNETGEVHNNQTGIYFHLIGYRQTSDFFSDNNHFAVAYWSMSQQKDYKILIYNVNDLENPKTLDIGNREIMCLKVSPDSKSILIGFYESDNPIFSQYKVILYDIESNQPKWQALISDSRPFCIDFSGDGRRIAIGTDAGQSIVLDASNGAKIANYSNGGYIDDICLNYDGTILVTGSSNGWIMSWDIDNNKLISHIIDPGINMFTVPIDGVFIGIRVFSVALSNDNKTIISGSVEGIKFWDIDSGKLKYATRRQLSGQFISDFEISKDEKFMVVGDDANDVLSYFTLDLNVEVTANNINLKQIIVSPNPASDYIEIQPSEGWQPSEGSDIHIIDMLGIDVSPAGGGIKGGGRIDISNLSPGIYFIKIGNRVEEFVKL
jgi:WD40 repeat protein